MKQLLVLKSCLSSHFVGTHAKHRKPTPVRAKLTIKLEGITKNRAPSPRWTASKKD